MKDMPSRKMTVDLPEADVIKLQRILPWGTQTKLFRGFVKRILRIYDEQGALGITKLLKELAKEELYNED